MPERIPEGTPILVSACLLGCNCRYNAEVRGRHDLPTGGPSLIPICPEVAGGLPTPRPAARIEPMVLEGGPVGLDGELDRRLDGGDVLDGRARVRDQEGRDVTNEFLKGAQVALEVARRTGASTALLKSRSPSCGVGGLSDHGELRAGNGVTAELLRRHGIVVEAVDFDAEDSSKETP